VEQWNLNKQGSQQPGLSLKAPATPSPFERLVKLYADAPAAGPANIKLSFQNDVEQLIEVLIDQLYRGTIQPGAVNEELYLLLAKELYGAVEKGFGKKLAELEVGTPDHNMLKALRENIYQFSGAKTYQELRHFADMLVGDDGQLRSFEAFRDEVMKLHKQYNQNWLYTEYSMAAGNAQIASRWVDIEAQKATLPLLQLRVVMDDNSRHKQWNRVTRPVDDPVWEYLMPLIDWGCRCTVVQLADGEITKPNELPGADLLKEEFRFNPGKEQAIFSKNHPYYQVQRGDAARAANNFGLSIPE
jgi:hypothetical protein